MKSAAAAAVYGLELEVDAERERLLVFADGAFEPRIEAADERTLVLILPGLELDSSAPTRIAPTAQGTIRRVTAFESAERAGRGPEVRVVVQRRPGEAPRLEQRGTTLALDFLPLLRPPSRSRPEEVSIQYRGVPVRRIVSDLARAAGETLILEESLAGSLTIEGPGKVGRDEAMALIDSILLLRGFAAIPSPGGARVVVPMSGAAAPWVGEAELSDSDASVTALIRLEAVGAEVLASALTPYLGTSTIASAFPPTNSLILSGAASRLRRLQTMIEALDAVETVRTVNWPLHFADAEQVAEQLVEILGEDVIQAVASDARHNALLLRIRAEDVDRARDVVDRLDRPAIGPGVLRVIKLRYADPDSMAQLLTDLRDGGGGSRGVESEENRQAGLKGQGFEVMVDAPTRSLVVQAAPEAFSNLIELVRELDREPASVRVEVVVASVTLADRLELGVEYLIPTLSNTKTPQDLIATVASSMGAGGANGPSYTASFGRAPFPLTVLDPVSGQQVPILNPFTGDPLLIPRESGALTLDGGEARAEILIRPQLLVISGEEHTFFAGDNIPIPVANTDEGGEALQVRQEIQRQDVGTTVRVLPTVGQAGGVMLELDVEVSSLASSVAGDVSRLGPSIEEIEVQSLIRLRDGEVAVIAAAQRPGTEHTVTGVPWLRSLPGLGFLFRRTTHTEVRRYLLITAQAELLRPEAKELAASLARLAAED